MAIGDDKDRKLGKNVSFSEDQRQVLLQLIAVGYKSGGLQSESAHDLVKSIRMAVDFSEAEKEIQKKRGERKAAEAKAGAAKK